MGKITTIRLVTCSPSHACFHLCTKCRRMPTLEAMNRDFRKGYLDIDFPTQPFTYPPVLLSDSIRVFFANLPFLAGATLVIYIPGKLATQFLCYLLDIPFAGVLSYFVLEISDL